MKTGLFISSLRNKIFLFIIVVIALFAIVSSVLVNLVVGYQMTGNYGTEKEAAIESLSSSLSPILDAHDYQQIKQILVSSLISQNIVFIAVYDDLGILIESTGKDGINNVGLETERYDIASSSENVGSFEIGFSPRYIDDLVGRTTLVLIVILIGILLITGLALIIFLGNTVIRPLEAFTKTIKKFGPNNLSVRMDIQTKDEIGVLATNFNQMATDLEKSYLKLEEARVDLEQKVEFRTRGERRRSEQLRAINEVGRRISAILSQDELLPYVAESLQETFNYYNVNIFLSAPELGGVVLKAGAGGYKSTIPLGFFINFDDDIVGKVAHTGKPLNIGDVTQEANNSFYREFSETRSEMTVPISIGTETLGVLDIQSIDIDAFDEIDLFTAQTLGDQLAVAIENARLYRESQDIAVLDERNRMAREIHDTLAQGFTGIILQLEAAEQILEEDLDLARKHLNRARKLAKESLKEARRSVWALRPQELEQLPLIEALRHQIQTFSQDTAVEAVFKSPQSEQILPPEIENTLLRIFQEALTNVKKHAQASKVEIELIIEQNDVRLRIDDNGVGFIAESLTEKRFGLISMRERAKLLGGSLEIRSEKRKGTHLEVVIPIDRKTE